MKTILINSISITILLYCGMINAQYVQIKEENKTLAEEIKLDYPEEDHIAINSKETYTIEYSKKNKAPYFSADYEENILALKDGTPLYKTIFYDNQNEITKIAGAGEGKYKHIFINPRYSDYEDDGIFHSDAKLCYFQLPFKVRGTKMKYSYNRKVKDIKYLTRVLFNDYYPIRKKEIEFIIPDNYNIELMEFNFEGFDIEKSKKYDAKKKITKYLYTINNLNAIKNEAGAPSAAKMFPHILVISKSYKIKDEEIILFNNTDALYKWYQSLIEQVKNKPESLKNKVEEITKDDKSPLDKMTSIFYWVQDNIRYIAFEEGIMGFKPQSDIEVFNNKYGDCKGMANLLRSMLKLVNIDARHTWIGTRDIPYDYSIPSLAVDNHMICTAFINERPYYLDATQKYIPIGKYAYRIQGRPALIANGLNYKINYIPEYDPEYNSINKIISLSIEGSNLKGKYNITYDGESRTDLIYEYESTENSYKEEALYKYLTDYNKNIKIANIESRGLEERDKPLNFNYDISISNQITELDNEIYLSLDFENDLLDATIDSTRTYDYEFDLKSVIKNQTTLIISNGLRVQYLPKPVDINTKNYSFKASLKESDGTLIYNKEITYKDSRLSKEDFKAWNESIEELSEFYKDQIILIKN